MDDFIRKYEAIEDAYYNENPYTRLFERKGGNVQRPLILYGSGKMCHSVLWVCNLSERKVSAICDSYKNGFYMDTGLKIISPDQLMKDYPDADVMISSSQYAEDIKRTLISMGFPEERIYPPLALPLMDPSDFRRDCLSGYQWAYEFFKDDISKKIILDRIRMYFTGAGLKKTSSFPAYFDPEIIKLGENEVFIDAGAYIGDTAEEFIRQTESRNTGGYRRIYSFEPDGPTREIAVRNLKGYKNIEIIGKGLWSHDTVLEFYSDHGNGSSRFEQGEKNGKVPATSIDSMFAEKSCDELPTFIKMDIEGAEKEALVGAKNIIAGKHPKLAICVYHKPQDIYELPKLIYEIDPNYKFALHQCEDGIYDTILYAV